MLSSANREYDRHQRLTALAVAEAERLAGRGPLVLARSLRTYQAAAVALSLEAMDGLLVEQGLDTAAEAAVVPTSLLTAVPATVRMLTTAANTAAMARLVQTLVGDASRTARAVDSATRPAVSGYVRSLRPPSCARCAILAGRVYPVSQGFQRHPQCDCLMTPTDQTVGPSLVVDQQEAFENGWVTGLSKADSEAIRMGADMGQVVNVRRKKAGLTVGGSVMVRAGRLTPAGCLARAGGDREAAIALLRQFRYIA